MMIEMPGERVVMAGQLTRASRYRLAVAGDFDSRALSNLIRLAEVARDVLAESEILTTPRNITHAYELEMDVSA
jgi:hypothetical protein